MHEIIMHNMHFMHSYQTYTVGRVAVFTDITAPDELTDDREEFGELGALILDRREATIFEGDDHEHVGYIKV